MDSVSAISYGNDASKAALSAVNAAKNKKPMSSGKPTSNHSNAST